MEVSSSAPNGTEESRRRSGRVVRKPDVFAEEHYDGSLPTNGTTNRKRPAPTTTEDDEQDDEDEDEDEESEEDNDEDEPDEEELKAQRRARRAKPQAAKPAAKRAKTTNGPSTTLAFRSANAQKGAGNKASRAQKARARPSQAHQQGLYAEVFGKGQSPEDAASVWFQSVQRDSVAGIRDLINFVLQCIGCDSKIESQDIEDLDSVPTRLGDVLQEYEQQKAPDYPLVSKQKQYAGFQTVLEEFFKAIIKALHVSGFFYDQPEVYDNIHVWVATMSGANYKSFRHTSTIISLAMSTALCEVAKELQETMATLKTQFDAEKKKKTVNKARVKTIEASQKDTEARLETIDTQLRDAFDTVYVHRYRDVEERIRAPCVAALGSWIVLYRKMFLEGQFLRYLGWVLNDTSSPTRLEDVKQLKILFKNKHNIGALRAFTDRFRPRLVEMGARDADVSVRVEAIELLDRLRDAELLEPDDIDTIGRLIFDSEPRIRKAVAKFFVSNIEDLYKATIEDFDEAQYQEALPTEDDTDDYLVPSRSWIKFKCLGSILAGYDSDDESLDGATTRSLPMDISSDSRYTLATQFIYPHMKELHEWELLAGYLLYDHSSIPASGGEDDINIQVQQAYQLSPSEDIILLDVLHSAVKQHLQSILEAPANRRTNATKDQIREKQEAAAQNLTELLPKLLSKYGSTPQSASSILRIEQLLDIGLINDLQSGEATYSAILDDISKQFTSHSDKKVLAAASVAFRNARSYEQSKEAADSKVQEIWTESVSTLASLLQGKDAEKRGSLDKSSLAAVVDISLRLAELAGVYDCTHLIESRMSSTSNKKQRGKANDQGTLLDLLLQLLRRGEPDADTTDAFAELEDQLCTALVELFSRYFRWKVFGLKKAISANDAGQLSTRSLSEFAMTRTSFVQNIAPIIILRTPLDPVCYNAILNVLELFALFTTIRNMHPDKDELDEDVDRDLHSLIISMPTDIIREVMVTHDRLEKSFAKKTRRKIETSDKRKSKDAVQDDEEDIEKPPEDSDDEAEDSDLDEEDDEDGLEGAGKGAKKQAALLAEQNLCELTSKIIFALVGGAIKDDKVKQRLMLNRTKLGKNYSTLLSYLDDKKEKKKPKTNVKADAKKSVTERAKAPSKPAVSEEMVVDDDIEDGDDEDEEEAQRRRDLEEVEDDEHEDEADNEAGREEVEDGIIGD
ncbi:cohesin complex subunit [Elasticomyces elasticus]|uniref:Cohesin complex subunit n=1 Tax=Exophiala sideris TaxID=1016849 RepID=A0ABR0JIH1_9EURO|nr:cohesin complex subunit [Elasticomyces elasticus]KAK5034206.1 cohesin complex subunit [Exophiala sideris]KAK5042502.1 cohesin complex subunit [Exophiala sideris]KAK5065584.1 cohesin complex subunit [Exophiala sideris]KAK5185958.1 cohesin complex subunit [Eurotiomycetes sp. CCFEE 6388]